MDKYEYRVKLEQIEKLAAKKDYVTAAEIADGIDWRKVKSITTLSLIADIYEATDRLEDCYEILNMVYDRSSVGRRAVYRLAEIAIKMQDFEEAIDLYKEFVKIAPHDLNRYILKYKIYRERGSSVEDQIVILEEFKSHEYDERWAYELACLYEEAGRIPECIEECDELILWFSEGEYVVKAMELKMKYQALTATQQEKYEHRFEYLQEEGETEEAEEIEETSDTEAADTAETEDGQEATENKAEVTVSEEASEDDTPQISVINTNKFSTINLQEELAKGIRDIFEEDEKQKADETEEETVDAEEDKKADTKEFLKADTKKFIKEEMTIPEEVTEEKTEAEETEKAAISETAEIQSELLKYAPVEKESRMEDMLCVEEDGQISIALENESILEKQITGQMSIEEILEAWEEKKRQAKAKIDAAEEGRKPMVQVETGEIASLLEDFIPKTPKGVLEEPEAAEIKENEEFPEQVLEDDLPQDIGLAEEIPEEEAETIEETETVEEAETIEETETVEETETIEEAETVEETENIEETEVAETAEDIDETEDHSIGQNTASMLDAIERALAREIAPMETAGVYLTEEQEKIFAYFTSVSGMKKQLLKLLEEEKMYAGREDSREGNLIITGHTGNGKTTLAIDIVKAIQKQRHVKGAKLAKVTGDGLNKKEPAEIMKKLGGGALVVERAGGMNGKTVEKLSEAMEGNTGGILVILEDDHEEIANLMKDHEGFAAKFSRSVDIPIFSNDELVAFGKSYAEEKEYYFDEMAILALYDSIGIRQTAEHVVNIAEVKDMIDEAIAHAEKKSRGFFARLSKKRIDEYGNKLLLEEDFEN